jgi:hypothetical protein
VVSKGGGPHPHNHPAVLVHGRQAKLYLRPVNPADKRRELVERLRATGIKPPVPEQPRPGFYS